MITHAASRKHYYTVLLDRPEAGSFCIQIGIITAFQEKLQALLKAVLNRFANSRSQ